MANKRVVSVVPDNDDAPVTRIEVPVINGVSVLTQRKEEVNEDDFALPADAVKQGTSPAFKRKVTTSINKMRDAQMEKRREGTGGAASKQVDDKEFLTGYKSFDVVEPPYNLAHLAKLYEVSSPHYAAVNAKVSNIVGLGFKLVENNKSKRNFEKIADNEERTKRERRRLAQHRDDLLETLDKLNKEDSFTDVLVKVWRDYEVSGNGYLEVGRKRDGTIGYVGHIPMQTLRIRRERDGFIQLSGRKAQFFANFGAGFDDEGNRISIPNPISDETPNEVIHFMKYSPTSGYYGVPDIIAAQQAIAGNEFAGRFNLDYFENKAVPRHVIVLKGAELGASSQTALLSFFETGLKGQHHRSLYIPLPGDTQENKIEFSIDAIEAGVQDASFVNYRRANLSDILMAHRVPISKVSTAEGASLAIARDADKTFKEQVCAPEQKSGEKKVNQIIREMTDALEFKLNEMSLTDENTQSQIDERRRKTGVETANEQRAKRGEPSIEGGDELFDMNAATKVAEMSDKTTRRGQDKAAEAKAAAPATGSAGANSNGNPTGTRQRDTQRSANATDSAGEGRNPQGAGRTTP